MEKLVLIYLLIVDNNKVEWRQNEKSRRIKNRIIPPIIINPAPTPATFTHLCL
jgi:hypothetical protein